MAITEKLGKTSVSSTETEDTEHPYQVNLPNFQARAIRRLFDLEGIPNAKVGERLYLYAIEQKLKEIDNTEKNGIRFMLSYKEVK